MRALVAERRKIVDKYLTAIRSQSHQRRKARKEIAVKPKPKKKLSACTLKRPATRKGSSVLKKNAEWRAFVSALYCSCEDT